MDKSQKLSDYDLNAINIVASKAFLLCETGDWIAHDSLIIGPTYLLKYEERKALLITMPRTEEDVAYVRRALKPRNEKHNLIALSRCLRFQGGKFDSNVPEEDRKWLGELMSENRFLFSQLEEDVKCYIREAYELADQL